LRVCSAEDLVVMKAFAARPQDWIDVEGILIRQRVKLDWDYIYANLTPLAELKENPSLVTQLREVEARARSTAEEGGPA